MFHVKPKIMELYFRKVLITFIASFFSIYLSSQKEGRLSLGTSLDYGTGRKFNNYATALYFNYNLMERIRISPSYNYFINTDNASLKTFSLNCHYLIPELASNLFPVLKNHDVSIYPIAGFLISSSGSNKNSCFVCYADGSTVDKKFSSSFGFNFGVGVEYKIPTLLPLLRDMNLNFELKYQISDSYSRPLASFGLLYDF